MTLPIGAEADYIGNVDLVKNQGVTWKDDSPWRRVRIWRYPR